MSGNGSLSIPRLAFALAGVALISVAFLRGNYLLGLGCGIAYVFVTTAAIWLFAQSLARKQRASRICAITIAILSVPIGLVMAFPAAINSDIQYFIDSQATDRTVRAELKQVFASDPVFSNLSLSTRHLKALNVTISGTLPTRNDLERLRNRILTECPTLKRCALHWNLTLHDSGHRIDSPDRELFPSTEEEG
ncbi:hypothetical protein Mal52_36670 [Symmachiella dynata]|uniref:Uncharacterized protein n=2 Tax=Symmachiella dynata TaxID=2527995 RepID=A0A517ZRS8_9PLAN|nr:hypothetical protein Mal52_36670 [Symmachiella dynata]